ncbi:FHA domain-containing protein [archaeon]|nr:MAG: FHA domain-containing protein [archaeon]
MVFLLTPDGEFRQLPCPGTVTIGRDEDNNIVERHRTVSGKHCKIILEPIAGVKSKVQMWLEDSKSMNGTYVGPSPLEIEKVIGRAAIHINWYFRIGHLTKYFQIVEHIPLDADIIVPELTILPKDGKGRMGTRTMGASVDLVLPEIKTSTLPKLDIPAKPANNEGKAGGTVHFAEENPVVVGNSVDGVLPVLTGAIDPGSKTAEGVRPFPQLPSTEAKAYSNPSSVQTNPPKGTAFGALKLPTFRVYDKLKEGSLLKYLDLLDQWKEQLFSIKDHILKGNSDLDRYIKAILAKSYRAKQSKKGRYQGRYLYLANPKVVDKVRDGNSVKGDTPRETLLAELVAESMSRQLEVEGGVYECSERVLNGLHELLTHCFLGAQIGPTFVQNMSDENKELDFLLQNELLTVLQACIHSAQSLQSSPLISSITEYYRKRENPCEMVSIVEECVTIMQRIAAFIVKSDEIVNEEFSVGEYYEVVLMCISTVVEEIYDVYTVLLTLAAEAEQAAVTHTHTNKGSKQVHSTRLMDSYNEEVEEMRQMKYDADLLSLLERVREQEAGLISEKFKR